MAEKKRRSVSLEPDVHEYLAESKRNGSGLVNDLVKRHMEGGLDGKDAETVVLDMRIERLESEIAEMESRITSKENLLEELRSRRDTQSAKHAADRQDAIEAAIINIRPTSFHDLAPPADQLAGVEAIVPIAETHGLDPEELHAEAVDRILPEADTDA